MDRSRALLIAALLVCTPCAAMLAGGAASALGALPREIHWLAPGADRRAALTTEPAECFSPSLDPSTRGLEEIGRAVFISPTLLGGQAARAGIACSSCHSGGRTNPHFLFPGVSGAPGTADVTSSLFSEVRGDGLANPVPIPDLAAPRETHKISRDDDAALAAFLRGLIVEEFAGPEPAPRILQGLTAYVRAIKPEACPAAPIQPRTAPAAIAQVLASVRAADAALSEKDAAAAITLLGAARAGLGRLHERFPRPADSAIRAGLIRASQELEMAAAAATRDPQQAQLQLTIFLARANQWSSAVHAAAPHSLYDAQTITEALAQAGP